MERKDWRRTRRNILSMGAVLVGAALSSGRARGHERDTFFDWRFDREGHRDREDFGWKFDREGRYRDRDDSDCWRRGRGVNCCLKGTHIRTTDGERKIEDLHIGDLVITIGGGAQPIEWIARRRYQRAPNQRWAGSIRPVRVARNALGSNIPQADLFVSQGHNLFFDGVLIRACDLINGTTIAVDGCNGWSEIEYFHIKLAAHNAIFSEGTPSETLLIKAGDGEVFDNFKEYEQLYGQSGTEERPFAPAFTDTSSGGQAALRSHLRSALSPWIDRRNRFEKIRDRLLDRADTLAT
jgi:Hint domain